MAFLAGAVVAAAWLLLKPAGGRSSKALPTEWPLSPRGVFNNDERRAYRLLRDALPQHVILSKLPLVRFCQPSDLGKLRYWFDLLGATHVGFAICNSNGRVLAALDLESERSPSGRTHPSRHSRRAAQIKQAVLSACRVRYLRCAIDNLPTVAELQLLVPHGLAPPRAAAAPDVQRIDAARDSLSSTVAARRAERSAMWQDSSFFQDSFFGDGAPGDIVGVVTDHPPEAQREAPQTMRG